MTRIQTEGANVFREMRRKAQQLSRGECERILSEASCGVLAVTGDGGYPYAVPVNHVYRDGRIAFHCAKQGHKIDAVRASDKVSFCVIAADEVIPGERTTAYVSVIAFGRARILEKEEELRPVCEAIGEKFCPQHLEACREETDQVLAAGGMYAVEIEVEHLSGKCGREVLKRRQEG